MNRDNDNPKPIEIKLCNVVHTLKTDSFSMTMSGICAATTLPDGTQVEAIFADGFTYEEVVRSVFRDLGLSFLPSFKIQRAPRRIITHYMKLVEKS